MTTTENIKIDVDATSVNRLISILERLDKTFDDSGKSAENFEDDLDDAKGGGGDLNLDTWEYFTENFKFLFKLP